MNLRPGEIKILKALSKGEKSYSELKEETKLNFTFLSNYLKNLQIQNLIERDIQNRKYKLKPLSLKALYLNEIIEFLKEQKDFDFYPLFSIFYENKDFDTNIIKTQILEKVKNDKEFMESIKKIKYTISEIQATLILKELKKEEIEILKEFSNRLKNVVNILVKYNLFEYEILKNKIKRKEDLKNLKILLEDAEEFLLEKGMKEKERKEIEQFMIFLKNKKNFKVCQKILNIELPKIVFLIDFNFGDFLNKYEILQKL